MTRLVTATLFLLCIVPATVPAQSGVPLWTNVYSELVSSGSSGIGAAIATDRNRDILITTSYGASGAHDFVTIKYSSAGVPLWIQRYSDGSFLNGDDDARALALDGSGNVYVTGTSYNPITQTDRSTVAYSCAGMPLWTNRYLSPDNQYEEGYSIAVDTNNGHVYVTGPSSTIVTDRDYLTIAYSTNGVPLWTNRYGGGGVQTATDVAVAHNGNVYVSGVNGNRSVTLAYASNGAPVWTNLDTGTRALVGSNDTLYFCEASTIRAFSPAAVLLWTNQYIGPSGGPDTLYSLAQGVNGRIYVAGESAGFFFDSDYVTLAYSSAGVPLWTNRFDGSAYDYDSPQGLAVDRSGNAYVTGTSFATNGFVDWATIAYSSAGVPLWTNRYNGPGNKHDQPFAITVDDDGNVVVIGYSTRNDGLVDIVTIKYGGADALPFPGPLYIERIGNAVRLSWSNPGFGLQSSSSLRGSFTNVMGATSPYTNAIGSSQRFFRLQAN